MIDENIESKPYKKGDILILEIEVTDEEKSFNFLGKAIMNKLNTDEFGFNIDKVYFSKEKYVDNIPSKLREEIVIKLQNCLNEINELMN